MTEKHEEDEVLEAMSHREEKLHLKGSLKWWTRAEAWTIFQLAWPLNIMSTQRPGVRCEAGYSGYFPAISERTTRHGRA